MPGGHVRPILPRAQRPLRKWCSLWLVKSWHGLSAEVGMAGLRGLFHHSFVLVHGASARRAVAVPRRIAVPGTGSGLGDDVDWHGLPDRTLAARSLVLDPLELASGRCFVRGGYLPLLAVRSALQLEATRRLARSFAQSARAATGHDRDTLTRAASGVPGTFVRNGGLEPRDRAGGLLADDWFRDRNWRSHDSHGRRGIGAEIRGGVYQVPLGRPCSPPQTACKTVD
jgi:hypothetical protein